MLVVSRKSEESIIIEPADGSDIIEIKVISNDNQVKIGVDAPKTYKIWRKELYNTVNENRSAVANTTPKNLKDLSNLIYRDGE